MSVKVSKHRYTKRDHMTAYLVLFVIICVILIGAGLLYFTGIFDPIEVGSALVDAKPMELATQPPKAFADFFFASAQAAGDNAETTAESPAPEAEPTAPASGQDLESILADIVAEDNGEPEITEAEQVTVSKDDLSLNKNLPTDIYNVLLLATDSRSVTAHGGRTDVMIIASLNRQTSEIRLVSLSRDMYLPIPGASDNKLNAAYAYGGPNLAMKTVNHNFELNIQDYAIVNFHTMAAIVDAIGGVDIYLEPGEWEWLNYNVALGEDYEGFSKSATRRTLSAADQETTVHLDGLQAVSYARIRKMDNDFQRGSRQRILLQAMLNKGMANLSLSTFLSLATNVMSSISTNVTLQTVIDVGRWALEMDNIGMEELSIPTAGTYHSAIEKDMDVIVVNLKQNVSDLHTFLYGEYIPAAGQ